MNKRMTLPILLLLAFSVILVTACTPQEATAPEIDTDENLSYPISPPVIEAEEEALSDTAYPITEEMSSEQLILKIPQPNDDSGIIYGTLNSLTMDQPVAYSKIYLATKVYLDPGDEFILSIQDNASPQAISTENGEFLIINIPPDDYLLALVTPINTYPILDENGENIELTIRGGESIDLGNVYANWPDFD
jgi:hypothetical protein